jgi:hypothetical protein
MDGNRYYGVRVEGAKYGVSFGSAPCYRNILHCQPFDTLGNHPRHFGLAVCDLLRTVSVIISARQPVTRAAARIDEVDGGRTKRRFSGRPQCDLASVDQTVPPTSALKRIADSSQTLRHVR